MKKLIRVLICVLLAATVSPVFAKAVEIPGENTGEASQGGYVRFSGSIGKYPITLYMDPDAAVGERVGYYYYHSNVNSHFKITMVSSKWNGYGRNITLYEYTHKGFHSGTFVGYLSCSPYDQTWVFSGTFTNSKGQRFNFYLYG